MQIKKEETEWFSDFSHTMGYFAVVVMNPIIASSN